MSDTDLLARAVAAEKLAAERLEFAQQLHGQVTDLERALLAQVRDAEALKAERDAAIETAAHISAERDALKAAAKGAIEWYESDAPDWGDERAYVFAALRSALSKEAR